MELITRQEAAERLAVSIKTLDAMIQRGSLKAYRIGPKIVRLDTGDIDAYLNSHLMKPQTADRKEPQKRTCRYVPGMNVV